MIELIPAIDIIDGKCVRLSQGDYDTQKVYNESPLEVAKEFEANGYICTTITPTKRLTGNNIRLKINIFKTCGLLRLKRQKVSWLCQIQRCY